MSVERCPELLNPKTVVHDVPETFEKCQSLLIYKNDTDTIFTFTNNSIHQYNTKKQSFQIYDKYCNIQNHFYAPKKKNCTNQFASKKRQKKSRVT